MRIQKPIGTLVMISSVAVYVLLVHSFWGWTSWDPLVVFWSALYFITLAGMMVAIHVPSSKESKIPEGRIIALVPTYNESSKAVVKTIESLLSGSVEIDEIHVIDDGSDTPMVEYEHPRVFCHWHQHMGKRYTQAAVLRKMNPSSMDFILTVDVDTKLDTYAVEYLLKEMANPKIKVCTSTVLASNFSKNVITRMQEFNCGVYFMIARSSRRIRGLLGTAPGACSLYRSEILYFHLDDSLRSGAAGEERRSYVHSALEGKAIYVPEAVVYTRVPEDMGRLWGERVRWNIFNWNSIPVFLANLGIKGCILPILNYFNALLTPLGILAIVYALVIGSPMLLLYSTLSFVFIAYLQSLLFILARPNWTVTQRMISWLVITPVLFFFTSFFFGMTRYFAFARMKEKEWGSKAAVTAEAMLGAYMQEIQTHHDKTQEKYETLASICEWLEAQIEDLERKIRDSAEQRSTMEEECEEFKELIQGLTEDLKESQEIESAMMNFHDEFGEQVKALEEELQYSKELEAGVCASVQNVCTLFTEADAGLFAEEGQATSSVAVQEVESEDAALIERVEADLRERVKRLRSKKDRQRAHRLYRGLRSDKFRGR